LKIGFLLTERSELFARPPGDDDDASRHFVDRSVAARDSAYQRAGRSAVRDDAPASYRAAMLEATLAREKSDFQTALDKLARDDPPPPPPPPPAQVGDAGDSGKRRRRWDQPPAQVAASSSAWGDAPVGQAQESSWSDGAPASSNGNATTATTSSSSSGSKKRRSRWDETPVAAAGLTPSGKVSKWDATPVGVGMATPVAGSLAAAMMTPTGALSGEALQAARLDREIEARNRPLSDADLDELLPKKGYKVVEAPAGYVPVRSDAAKLLATPTPLTAGGFALADDEAARLLGNDEYANLQVPGDLPDLKPEDRPYFAKILDGNVDDSGLSPEEERERRIMRLLLKIKNGTPQMRKQAMRMITDKAREFGPAALFNQILPLLRSATLEDQERHLLVKVIDRILYKLDDLVRPYVHKILVVIEPLLIDEDFYARAEGREIISNLAKAAGLATMIATLRPDIDHVDEYVRNTTARAFSVVGSALGIPALLPFLRAVCASKKSWQARHTGIKIVQQIALLMGCAVLPHLKALVDCVGAGLQDEQQKVRTIAALAISGLAEAATPYGIESFDDVLRPLWYGIRQHRGKGLAAFLKAIGFIIPLMDAEYASYYTKEVMVILIREFASPDEEMKKIVLKVIKQVLLTEGVEAAYVRSDIVPEYFKNFWVRRMALDKRNYKQLVETTLELAVKVGGAQVVRLLVPGLKDESEPYRRMVMDTIEQVVAALGVADVDGPLEEQLVDGVLFAFQEQQTEDADVMLRGFGTVVNKLGARARPYLPQICGNIKWRLNYKSAAVRQQAADLLARIAVVIQQCDQEQLLCHLGVVLYEQLGEEFPDTLGSILGALKAIVNVIGMTRMTPPIKDLLPRLTPILRNRHEKVQETSIDLVGRIADRGPTFVSAREWMRICLTGDHEALVEGVGWLPLPLVAVGQRVWSLDAFGSDTAGWHTVEGTTAVKLPPGDQLLHMSTTRLNVLASKEHTHWVREYNSNAAGGVGVWTKETSETLASDRWFMTAAQPAQSADWQWVEPFLQDVNADAAKQVAFCSLLGFYVGDGALRMSDTHGDGYSETQKLVVLHQSSDGLSWLETQLSVLGWLVDDAAAALAAYTAGRVAPAFYLYGVGTDDCGYRTNHAGLYDMLWPMSDNPLSLSNDTPMPVRLAALDSLLRQAAPGGAHGDAWLPSETEYAGPYGPAVFAVDDERAAWADYPPAFRSARWAALRQWRARRRARVLAAMAAALPPAQLPGAKRQVHQRDGAPPSFSAPVRDAVCNVCTYVAPAARYGMLSTQKRALLNHMTACCEWQATVAAQTAVEAVESVAPPLVAASPAPATSARTCALLDLVVDGELLLPVPAARAPTTHGSAQQSEYAGLDITVDELAELKRILAMSHLPQAGAAALPIDAIPPRWDGYLMRQLYYPWRQQLSVRQARALIVGHVVANGVQAGTTPLKATTSSVLLRDDLSVLAAMAGYPCSVGVENSAGGASGLQARRGVTCWSLNYHAVVDADSLMPEPAREALTLVRKEARTWVDAGGVAVYCIKVETGNFLTRRVQPAAGEIHQVFTGNCHELLEMLKAPKKGIRRAAVNTFGYIARAIGPQDVLATLLNNLKVQERQNRVCTTVAIAIVAESCSPFTVLPALMNEYRVPELNVQNGVLKALSFMFEYIGEMAKDYVFAITSLLEDALADRDAVHRQTAAAALKHIALGVAGLSCEEALQHLFNYLWPNIFEVSPHVINNVLDAVEAYRIALGPSFLLGYLLHGLFHPARRVRSVMWRVFNTLYIGSQDALVAHYPRLNDARYDRTELDIFL
jgi:splicing factor 3B subunit 1